MSEYHTPRGSHRRKSSIITVGSLYRTNRSQQRSDKGKLDDADVSDALSKVGERIKSIDVEQQGENEAKKQLLTLETQ